MKYQYFIDSKVNIVFKQGTNVSLDTESAALPNSSGYHSHSVTVQSDKVSKIV